MPNRRCTPGYNPEQQRRRPTWFDIAPVGGAPPPISQLPGAVMVVTDAPGASAATGFGGAAAQQATRHARRIYVGGLPPSAKEEGVSTFFRCRASLAGPPAFPFARCRTSLCPPGARCSLQPQPQQVGAC